MCRIAGIASLALPISELQIAVAEMCRVQRHGGPDDEGIYANEEHGLVLGHRRLSLIDLSDAGHQPMHSTCGRYTITFNGEIYNYKELKAELISAGFSFATASDTEVILKAFAAKGVRSFESLDGMFAFALFDNKKEELYLVRDGQGIKPLYYFLDDDTLAFASEARAFQQLPWEVEEHPYWPVYLMAYGHLPEPITTLKGVAPLPKGSYLRFDLKSGKAKLETFVYNSFLEKECSRDEAIHQIQQTLKAAVKSHLLCDAPIGVFLSGGIDSSIIALLAGESVGEQLNTLSLYFREKRYSEKAYQATVSERLGGVHHEHQLTEKEFHFHLPEIIEAMDLPTSDGINTWFISRLAKEDGLKAVLSGLGGDELFGGYPSFRRIGLATTLQNLPRAALKSGRYSRKKKWRRLAYLSLAGTKGQYLFLRGLFTPASIAWYLNMDEREVWEILEEEPVLPDIHHLSHGNKASWMELNLYMQNQLLRDADVMSMAHGLELRVPFLDRHLVKLVASLPSKEKYAGHFGKQLLIDSFRSLLPEKVWQRRKMGFSLPFNEWLKKDEWVRSRMNSGGRDSLTILKQFDEGKLHWSSLITTLLLRTHRHEFQPAFFNA